MMSLSHNDFFSNIFILFLMSSLDQWLHTLITLTGSSGDRHNITWLQRQDVAEVVSGWMQDPSFLRLYFILWMKKIYVSLIKKMRRGRDCKAGTELYSRWFTMKLNPAELPRDHRGHLLWFYSIFNAKNNSRTRLSRLVQSYGHNILYISECPWILVHSHGAVLQSESQD